MIQMRSAIEEYCGAAEVNDSCQRRAAAIGLPSGSFGVIAGELIADC
jgi:hypothetical protein